MNFDEKCHAGTCDYYYENGASMSGFKEDFIYRLLKALNKTGCQETEQKIRDYFDLHYEDDGIEKREEIWQLYDRGQISDEELEIRISEYYALHPPPPAQAINLPGLPILAVEAVKDLYWGPDDTEAYFLDDYGASKKKRSKIEKLKKDLGRVLERVDDSDIAEYFRVSAEYREDELPAEHYYQRYRILFSRINQLYFELDGFLKYHKTGRGKPSLDRFYDFVYQVAKVYEELSGERFTSDVHKEAKGKDKVSQYKPLTKGMDFVWVAVDWLHKEIKPQKNPEEFSSKNIAHACEAARTKLNKSRPGV